MQNLKPGVKFSFRNVQYWTAEGDGGTMRGNHSVALHITLWSWGHQVVEGVYYSFKLPVLPYSELMYLIMLIDCCHTNNVCN